MSSQLLQRILKLLNELQVPVSKKVNDTLSCFPASAMFCEKRAIFFLLKISSRNIPPKKGKMKKS